MGLSVFLRGLAIGFGIAAPVATAEASRRGPGRLTAWTTTFALTVTNPTTILSFAAIFAGLGLGGTGGGYGPATLVVLEVFLGSAF